MFPDTVLLFVQTYIMRITLLETDFAFHYVRGRIGLGITQPNIVLASAPHPIKLSVIL